MDEREFEGQVALVTGGTGGIGSAVCKALVAAGATVCFTGRNQERGQRIAIETGTHFIACDNTVESDVQSCTDDILARFGAVSILVNNAGNPGPGHSIETMPVEAFDETIGIHLRGAFLMTRAVIPAMRKRGGGVIINIGSIAGHRVGGHSMAYAVAKAGLAHFTRWAAVELGPDNIRVNCISPGFVATDIHALAVAEPGRDNLSRYSEAIAPMFRTMQPLPHTGTVEDVAEAVVYLAGSCSAFVTGSDLVIDGGLSLGRKMLIKPAAKTRKA
ncbi:SDR family NAD(P)-dependent oxidoreductase [Hoeflea sp.]|uniref:SDR family NAD(P)-dependent oxidoreductase n=1 Tax=Hoeflea sp. TaxID=1940281 RepID=UPI003A92E266